MNAIHLLLIGLGALGAALLVDTLAGNRKKHNLLSRMDSSKDLIEINTLQVLLYQARTGGMRPAEFLTIGLLLGIFPGLVISLITGIWLLGIALGFLGIPAYYAYLMLRRDRTARDYEAFQPQVAYLLAEGIQTRGADLPSAINRVLESAPEPVQEDWRLIAAVFSSTRMDLDKLDRLLIQRNSPGLYLLVEAILLFQDRIPLLKNVLKDLRKTFSENLRVQFEAETSLSEQTGTLGLMSLIAASMLVIFTAASGPIREFYTSFLGQLIAVSLYGSILAIFLLGQYVVRKQIGTGAASPGLAVTRRWLAGRISSPDRTDVLVPPTTEIEINEPAPAPGNILKSYREEQ